MIHHFSIPAANPSHVAQVLSELWRGQVAPFPAHSGSYVVFQLDDAGTLIEVYPIGTQLVPGVNDEQLSFVNNSQVSIYTATHAAISVPTDAAEIMAIANREGWRAVRCDREGFFEVIEFWVENNLLLELMPPDFVPKYLSFMQPQNLQKLFATSSQSA
ncbi:hypothetical protein [Fortiea contorta]|uniref:hypothetical protein n=1 Tax=Fortiea contorta TaxID=1892405 RepID=UPI0003721F0D|nr:hypothetical protein [Fortiea contorta]